MKKKELVIALVLVGFLVFCGLSNYQEARRRADVSQAKASMREMRKGLAAYYTDHQAYPAQVPLADFAAVRPMETPRRTNPWWSPLEKIGGIHLGAVAPALTTPVAYLPTLPLDPWANATPETNLPFAYHLYTSTGTLRRDEGWMLTSPGPDRDYDITDYEPLYRPAEPFISLDLERLTFNNYSAELGRANGDLWALDLNDEQFNKIAPWDWD